ncbi:MAG: hypothetical protein KAW61_08335, partial [candidate division Zixibacteria bacterium]|nr:hypothetical protein [candidate division Zixibacteria bacterium]
MRQQVSIAVMGCLGLTVVGMMLGADPALATKNWEPVFNPKLTIERTSEAISIDGSLDDAGWRTASRTDMFVERYPGDMTKPDVKTEAYVTYDDDHLYVAFFCHDDPDAIRAT